MGTSNLGSALRETCICLAGPICGLESNRYVNPLVVIPLVWCREGNVCLLCCCFDRKLAPWTLCYLAMVHRETCKDAKAPKQPLELEIYGQLWPQPTMSDLEEGESEDVELPSAEPRVSSVCIVHPVYSFTRSFPSRCTCDGNVCDR